MPYNFAQRQDADYYDGADDGGTHCAKCGEEVSLCQCVSVSYNAEAAADYEASADLWRDFNLTKDEKDLPF